MYIIVNVLCVCVMLLNFSMEAKLSQRLGLKMVRTSLSEDI